MFKDTLVLFTGNEFGTLNKNFPNENEPIIKNVFLFVKKNVEITSM